jgi:PAS domain S-box-containing protein
VWYDPRTLRKVTVREGHRVAISATFFPVRGRDGRITHVAVAFRDMTAEMRATEEAQAERDLLWAIIEQSGDGVIVADADGVLRIFNPEAERQHGVPKQEVAPDQWARTYGLLAVDGRPLPLDQTPLYRALQGEKVAEARWLVRRPDGSTRILSGTATPLRRGDGSRAGAILVTRDETDRTRLEEDLKQAATFRERFVGIVGHDLKSPLTAITGAARFLLSRTELGEEQAELVHRIVSSAGRMERMIADLLDFTRSRLGGGFPVRPRATDLHQICRQIVDEAAVAHPDRRIVLEQNGDGRGAWDPDRVAQVISNLLDNALKYGAKESPVHVASRGRAADVLLEVRNAGPAIPADALPGLFDPFRRAASDERGGAERRGLGLGLYIAREIAAAHGGSIDVASSAEHGTAFTVRWPRRARKAA